MRHLYYPRCETLNRWCSFDTHFHDGAGSVSHLVLPIKEANTSVITSCSQCPLWLPRMQDQKSLTLHWRSFPGWRRERLTTYFEHEGGQFILKEYRCTIVNILGSTVRYLHATINRATLNAKPEFGPDGSSQTRRNPQVDWYGAGIGLPRSRGSSFWTVLDQNRTVFPVQTRTAGRLPRRVANTSTRCSALLLSTKSLHRSISSRHTHNWFSQSFHWIKYIIHLSIYFPPDTTFNSKSSNCTKSTSCVTLGASICCPLSMSSLWVNYCGSWLQSSHPTRSTASSATILLDPKFRAITVMW